MNVAFDSPIRLKSERAWRTYHGGRLIDAMHGDFSAHDSHFPEDWICSTVRAINPGREDVVEGLSRLADSGMTLKDCISADPVAALGADHVARWGESPGVLVKLIDAAERLGVQCHPDREKAHEFFNSPFGKTECWHIVGVRPPVVKGLRSDGAPAVEPSCVYMGFKPGVTEAAWRNVFDRQDIPAMLGMLHRIEVKSGDTFFIEGGMPHAIGAGCLLVEIQEPTDYTFRTEKVTPQGFTIPEKACHYGIGFDNMFKCFHYDGCDEAAARRRYMVAPQTVERTKEFVRTVIVGMPRTDCFSLERIDISGSCRIAADGRFSVLYVLSGHAWLECAAGAAPLRPGDQFFVPAAASDFSVAADGADGRVVVFKAGQGHRSPCL
ncbi:MAG: class I mannose-6-phosphate isomerase [Kiritimatiellae bacterium]|nr:class I mannose-6-phosphate isomerase [Kiritimatiellia bacterium]